MRGPGVEFLGNRRVVEQIEQKLAHGRLPHGLIFTGPDGVGKHTLAVGIAQMLNCRASDRPCGVCDPCRRIARENDAHVTTITVEEDASEIRIGQIRELRETFAVEVEQAAARVVIVDPARRMTAQAANALLKVLEEPPPRTYFVLITNNLTDLLATVRSRCQTYRFAPLSPDEIRSAGVTDDLVVRWSEGRVGFALTAEPGPLGQMRDAMLDFLEHAIRAEDRALAGLPSASADIARDKETYVEKLHVLVVLVADLLRLKHSMVPDVVNIDRLERLSRAAEAVTLDQLVTIGDTIATIETALGFHVHRQTLTDTLALSINPRTSEILNDKARRSR